MNIARCLMAAAMAGFSLSATVLRGDDAPRATDDSSMWVDPDAPPKGFMSPPKTAIPAAKLQTLKQIEEKRQESRNWMLQGYQEQLQAEAKEKGATPESEEYLAETAELARQAGLPDSETADELRASAGTKEKAGLGLRTDTTASPVQLGDAKTFQPLISVGSPSVPAPFVPVSNFFASPNAATFTFGSSSNLAASTSTSTPAPAVTTTDSGDMDIPGMTAAESDPASADLKDTDLLPGELASDANQGPHTALELELPLTRNSDRLAKIQDDALKVPGQPDKKPVTPPPVAQPVQPPSDTDQMVRDPTPIRVHLDDPYDILH